MQCATRDIECYLELTVKSSVMEWTSYLSTLTVDGLPFNGSPVVKTVFTTCIASHENLLLHCNCMLLAFCLAISINILVARDLSKWHF